MALPCELKQWLKFSTPSKPGTMSRILTGLEMKRREEGRGGQGLSLPGREEVTLASPSARCRPALPLLHSGFPASQQKKAQAAGAGGSRSRPAPAAHARGSSQPPQGAEQAGGQGPTLPQTGRAVEDVVVRTLRILLPRPHPLPRTARGALLHAAFAPAYNTTAHNLPREKPRWAMCGWPRCMSGAAACTPACLRR